MDQDEFVFNAADIPDDDAERLAYWQTRCLAACVEVVNLTKRLLEADQILLKQEKVLTSQASKIVKLTHELRTLTAESPWLEVVRKHLNSSTPEGLDEELERLTDLWGKKEEELRELSKKCEEYKARLSEFENGDNTPLE